MSDNGFLVLSRRREQSVFIDGRKIEVMVVSIRGNKVRLGFRCDKSIRVIRGEVMDRIDAEQGT